MRSVRKNRPSVYDHRDTNFSTATIARRKLGISLRKSTSFVIYITAPHTEIANQYIYAFVPILRKLIGIAVALGETLFSIITFEGKDIVC